MSLGQFIAVAVSTIVPDRMIGVSLYLKEPQDKSPRLYRGPNYPLKKDDIHRLIDAGHHRLFVAEGEFARFQSDLRESLTSALMDESLSPGERCGMLSELVRDFLDEAFRSTSPDKMVEGVRKLAGHTVELLSREDLVASQALSVLHHDWHTFTHSANVAFYCVMLAGALGIESEEELHHIATAAFLHDLGKLEIPAAILTKPGRLTDEEFAIIKRHPTIGFRRLCQREDLTLGQLMMVYQHHEREDGSGYPVGVLGSDIHEWAKICGVADVFEALTSDRPYRKRMSRRQATEIMERDSQTGLNREIFECWIALIEKP